MAVMVITPPGPLVDLATVKQHLRVDHCDEDALITAYLAAACAHIDGPGAFLGRPVGAQVLAFRATAPACRRLTLPIGPALSMVSINYMDGSGQVTTWPAENYALDDGDVVLGEGVEWPSSGMTIRYRAGYETTPPAIVAAVLIMVGDLYANRESGAVGTVVSELKTSVTVDRLLTPWRRVLI